MMNGLTILTCTYRYDARMEMLRRASTIFSRIDLPINWVVIEDSAHPDPAVFGLLAGNGKLNTKHLWYGPTKAWGNAQKNVALQWIRENVHDGVVYIADDDNAWSDALFYEMMNLEPMTVGVMPVGRQNPGQPLGVERPICYDGKIWGWDSNFSSRVFSCDMAGFCFDVRLLDNMDGNPWKATRRGGESIFLKELYAGRTKYEMQCLCDDCNWVGVWHDQPLEVGNPDCIFEPVQLPRFKIFY